MKTTFFAIGMAIAVSACGTTPINTSTARATPAERIYAPELMQAADDKVELIVARDAGAKGSACLTAVYLDGKRVSTIASAEKIVFHIAPGRHILGTGPNPEGKALCRVGAESMRRETEIIAELGKPLKYRLAFGASGEMAVMPTAF
ncbi:hypothetical protein [Stenotrophomonas rhizophila]|uniref:hypothetical protein n=1 Tax=Stenotrophomonas rhizophila TaxID=216778 RepID=UPI001E3A20FE|nr:hypothetical protein [Stenotrophomonas rhizophila]MCC7633850.1 hypothetical protein [Stenotrophomonas rhizophila]MCC7665380.1 hypothetical protein [Stenotrophomonas rhizophila]